MIIEHHSANQLFVPILDQMLSLNDIAVLIQPERCIMHTLVHITLMLRFPITL